MLPTLNEENTMKLLASMLPTHWAKNWDGPWGSPQDNKPGGNHRPSGGGGNRGGGSGRPPGDDWDKFMRKNQEKIQKLFPGGPGSSNDKKTLGVIGAIILLLWASTGIYMVETKELGVVTRFGEFHRTTQPGIHYHLPVPIERVFTPEVTTVNKLEVGFMSGVGDQERSIPEEALMLTGDENIVDIHFVVQWKIDKADHFLFNVRGPETIVKAVAESAMREVIGKVKIMSLISEGTGRKEAEDNTKALMQRMLSDYKSGIQIKAVNLLKADPPAAVIEAFQDVQSARLDMDTSRNQAEAYRNDIIPRARGQAEQMMQEAEAYKQEVIARAEGEASRFTAVYSQYKQSPKVIKDRMYLEAMEEIYTGMNKVIVSGDNANGVLPFLPLHQLSPAAGAPATGMNNLRGGN